MQIRIIWPVDRPRYSRPLMEMHHHRKQVFVDALGWELAIRGSWLEVDEFDNEHAVYLMALSSDGERHLGSVRLLPTTRPHMLGSIFSELCEAPVGEEVWEISRFVATPENPSGTNILRVHRAMAAALVDFAGRNGIHRYTLVAESKRVPVLLSVGWTVRPLSLPTMMGTDLVEAMEILLDAPSIRGMQRRIGPDLDRSLALASGAQAA